MSPHDLVTIEDDDAMPTSSSPLSRTGGSPRNGRVLYCRKCEGHGEKVVLKNHAPSCPYILCTCRSCERLNQKRLKSFNKRNKEKLELAAILTEQRRKERELDSDYQAPSRKLSSCSTSSSTMDSEQGGSSRTGLEGRSMSLGAMTVMSYDIWKAKCAAEKKRLEQEGKAPPSPIEEVKMRKRAHTFMAPEESKELPKVQPPHLNEKKKGRYIVLPTIPAMKIFVDEDMEKKMEENMDDTPAQNVQPQMETRVQELKITSPRAIKPIQAMPQPQSLPTTVPLQQSFIKPSVPMSVPSLPVSSLAPALSMAGNLNRFPAPATTSAPPANGFSAEQIVLLQNNILQQQNQALQQLLSSILPISNPSPPTTTPSPDLVTLLKYQQIAPKPVLETTPQDLLQTLLRPQPQAIFSHGM